MKLAVLVQCHKNPTQINRLLNVLVHPSVDLYIHVDKKSNIKNKISKRTRTYILSDNNQVSVTWGGYSQVEATLNLLKISVKNGQYDYFWLISGQDFLLKPIDWIVKTLEKSDGMNFIDCFYERGFEKRCQIYYPKWMIGKTLKARIGRKLWIIITGGNKRTFHFAARKKQPVKKYYAGSSWWCMSKQFIEWVILYLNENPEYKKFFENAICADEEFFQTLFMISPYKNKRKDMVCYVDWSNHHNNPKILEEKDLNKMFLSGKWIARKFDSDVDDYVISKLEELVKFRK